MLSSINQVVFRAATTLLCLALFFCSVGCEPGPRPVAEAEFEPNLVHAIKYQIREDIPTEQAGADAAWIVESMFGTPDQPKLPAIATDDEDLADLVSMERLLRASGPAEEQGRGLFRKHCTVCHGITGNGRGPTAASQWPYPRDYRMGIFKFKSTPFGIKPTRDDLAKTINDGIGGTAMKHIPELSEEDVQSLIDYVIYLTWRGEVERSLIDEAALELDLESGDRLLDTDVAMQMMGNDELKEKLDPILEFADGETVVNYEKYLEFKDKLTADAGLQERLEVASKEDEPDEETEQGRQLAAELADFEIYREMADELADDEELELALGAVLEKTTGDELHNYELYRDSWEVAEGYVSDTGGLWLEAEDEVLEVPDPPEDLPVAENYADVLAFRAGAQADAFEASVARGKEVFLGKDAACVKCHGEEGKGDGQTADYDEWTKDWTLRIGIKPEDRESIIPMLARGALPPKNVIPRNFSLGVFRGGSKSTDLYRRITQGVDGSPMPAASLVEGRFEQEDIWNLINFVRSLQSAESVQTETAAEPAATPAI